MAGHRRRGSSSGHRCGDAGLFVGRFAVSSIKYSHTYATEADHLKPALLIIDMLVDFLAEWPEVDRAQLVDAIRTLVKGCRAAGRPIIWVRQEFEPDLSDAFRDMRRRNIRF